MIPNLDAVQSIYEIDGGLFLNDMASLNNAIWPDLIFTYQFYMQDCPQVVNLTIPNAETSWVYVRRNNKLKWMDVFNANYLDLDITLLQIVNNSALLSVRGFNAVKNVDGFLIGVIHNQLLTINCAP